MLRNVIHNGLHTNSCKSACVLRRKRRLDPLQNQALTLIQFYRYKFAFAKLMPKCVDIITFTATSPVDSSMHLLNFHPESVLLTTTFLHFRTYLFCIKIRFKQQRGNFSAT